MKTADRIADLETKLAARTQDGRAFKGYTANVAAIRDELTRLRGLPGASPDSQKPAEDVSP